MTIRYDRLVIATGAKPVRPDLPGKRTSRASFCSAYDGRQFRRPSILTKQNPRAAVLIGAGYIGLEMADALTQRGVEVTLLWQRGHGITDG